MELGRVLTAMATPFDREGEVDYGQAKRLSLALLDAGSDGLVVAGTTARHQRCRTTRSWRSSAR